MKKDYYKILGVSEDAKLDDIKKVYRKLAFQYHPDRNPNKKDAEAKFKEISEAYYVLSDPKRRSEYDQMRRFGAGGSGAENFAGTHGFDFEELLRRFGGGARAGGRSASSGRYSAFDDIFSDLFANLGSGGSYRTARGPGGTTYQFYTTGGDEEDEYQQSGVRTQPSADVVVNLKISKEKADKGGKVTFKTPEGKTIEVKIPVGIKPGQKLRLTRQGRVCPTCRHEGDLILNIRTR